MNAPLEARSDDTEELGSYTVGTVCMTVLNKILYQVILTIGNGRITNRFAVT